jgi:intracellular septation protein A
MIKVAYAWENVNCQKSDAATLGGIECLVERVLSAALPLLGMLFVIMVVVAGIKVITAGGEREAMAKAKSTATYAVIGLVLALSAWLILAFIQYLTGVQLTILDIPSPSNR